MNIDQINNLLTYLDKLQGLSAAALVFFVCIAFGYAWRGLNFKWFPNDAIPLAVMGLGAILMMMIADGRPTTMPPHVWTARNAIVGFIIGGLAWAFHNYALWYLENWIRAKFGSDGPPPPPPPAQDLPAVPKPQTDPNQIKP